MVTIEYTGEPKPRGEDLLQVFLSVKEDGKEIDVEGFPKTSTIARAKFIGHEAERLAEWGKTLRAQMEQNAGPAPTLAVPTESKDAAAAIVCEVAADKTDGQGKVTESGIKVVQKGG